MDLLLNLYRKAYSVVVICFCFLFCFVFGFVGFLKFLCESKEGFIHRCIIGLKVENMCLEEKIENIRWCAHVGLT